MMNFNHSGSETRIYSVSSGNNMDGTIYDSKQHIHDSITLIKKSLAFFDGDTKKLLLNIVMYLKIASIYINNDWVLKWQTNQVLGHLIWAALQDDE